MASPNLEQRAQQFGSLVEPLFSSYFKSTYALVEFCAGHGHGGAYFDTKVKQIHFVDLRKVRGLARTVTKLTTPHQVFLLDLNNYHFPDSALAVIAIHACGELTDQIIKKSVQAQIPFAVMPCCYHGPPSNYDLRQPPDPRILTYPTKEEYYDAFRLQYLQEQHYQAILTSIDPKITPMNKVIVGLPT